MVYIEEFKDFVESVKEGLIRTYSIDSIERALRTDLHWEYHDDNTQFNIEREPNSDLQFILYLSYKDKFYQLVSYITDRVTNLYGYFPAEIGITPNKGKETFVRLNNLTRELLDDDKINYISIKFEAKYEDGLYTNKQKCPNILYHLTNANLDKIKRIGLHAKSNNRKSDHPDRIYLFANINNYADICEQLIENDIERGLVLKPYALLEINCKAKKYIIHTDPNYPKGVFIYDNIKPEYIKIIRENLIY